MTGQLRSILVRRWVICSLLGVLAVTGTGAVMPAAAEFRARQSIAGHGARTTTAGRSPAGTASDHASRHRTQTTPVQLPGWTPVSASVVPSGRADQGVTTLVTATGRRVVVTRGLAQIPSALTQEGWVHVGDPGSWGSYLVDAYQAAGDTKVKMFLVTTSTGRTVELVHPLTPREMINNSFAAVSPDGRWLVSGEWRTVHRLLVFALPALTTGLMKTTLPLASTIDLTRPVRNVQGCSFDGEDALLCTTDDPGVDLFPVSRQIVRIDLAHPLDGRPTTGHPALVGAVPQVSSPCAGHGEPEGIDVTDGIMRFTVVEPAACRGSTRLFVYTRSRL